MRRFLFAALCVSCAGALVACDGEELVCGPGTVQSGESCVPAGDSTQDAVDQLEEQDSAEPDGVELDGVELDGVEPDGVEESTELTPDEELVQGDTLSGAVIDLDGVAVVGAKVFLLEAGDVRKLSETDSEGGFTFEVEAGTAIELVASDGRGNGALRSFSLVAGENDAGLLVLQPLENIPSIVDVHGIGYEERLSRGEGNYLSPVYNAAVSEVYALSRQGGESNYRVVKLGLPGAEQTLLRDDERLSSSYSKQLRLLADRVLLYRAYRPTPGDPNTLTESDVFLDVQTGDELDHKAWWETHGGYHISGSKLCHFEVTQRQEAYDTLFGTAYEYRMRPSCLDSLTGQRSSGALLNSWYTQIAYSVSTEEGVLFVPRRDCDFENPSCEWDPPTQLMYTNFQNLQTRAVATLASGSSLVAEQQWNGEDLIVMEQAANSYVFKRLDVATGALSTVASIDLATQGYPSEVVRLPHRDVLLMQLRLGELSQGYFLLDGSDGSLQPLSRDYTVDGVDYRLCEGEWASCGYSVDDTGVISLFERFEGSGGYELLQVRLGVDGSTNARVFPVAEGDYGLPSLARSADSEAVALRDGRGFLQLHFGPLGAAMSAFQKVSFITANHTGMQFSADGSALYYFTRDPISGFEQLFRVRQD